MVGEDSAVRREVISVFIAPERVRVRRYEKMSNIKTTTTTRYETYQLQTNSSPSIHPNYSQFLPPPSPSVH
jgi:hypothetical protein